ncbi:MAG TPA: acyltransferase family protein [Dongiaceae bacterium]
MPYRADIDGLRALSVLAVVLYHAGVPLFAGGFVGVDVFFVISGFLITSLILHEQDAGAFSLTGFYHRRIRRILPALLAMVSACALVGWFLLAPADYAQLGGTIASATLSVSNLQFWLTAGYFDTPAAEKPLLHTWSLGLEEQFYLIFPLYLILVARYAPRWRLPVTATLCLGSFAIGAIDVSRDPNAAFFLPQARLWELLIGGLLAMDAVPALTRPAARSGAALLGLALIASAVLAYTGDRSFPGAAALPPTLGAALVIWSGKAGSSQVNRALSVRPLVFLGKISYSFYLWHFPLLAFGLYLGLGELTPVETASLVAAAFVLALLSWRFVEQPARHAGARLPWWRLVTVTVCCVLCVSSAGTGLLLWHGFPARMTDDAFGLIASQPLRNGGYRDCFVSSPARARIGKLCRIGDAATAPSFVLWGDSHGETLRGALHAAAAASNSAGVFAGEFGCPPLIGATQPQKPTCVAISDALFHLITETKSIDTVILAARWGWWAESSPYKREGGPPVPLGLAGHSDAEVGNHAALSASLEHTIAALLSAGKRVWLVGPVPEVGYDVPRYFYLRSLGFADGFDIAPTRAEFGQRQAFALDLLNDLADRYPVGTIWPHERLCNDTSCAIARDGHVLYADDDHLSVFGAQSIAGLFTPIFEGDSVVFRQH